MRALADTYDSAGDRMRDMARLGGRTLGDQDLLESSLLSPATAICAETAVLAATAGPDGILVESVAWEVDAAAIRGSVTVLESADAGAPRRVRGDRPPARAAARHRAASPAPRCSSRACRSR